MPTLEALPVPSPSVASSPPARSPMSPTPPPSRCWWRCLEGTRQVCPPEPPQNSQGKRSPDTPLGTWSGQLTGPRHPSPSHRDTLSSTPVAPAWPGHSSSSFKVSEPRQQPRQGGHRHHVAGGDHRRPSRLPERHQHATTPRHTPQQVPPLHNLSRGGNAQGTTPFFAPCLPRVQWDVCPHQHTTALACDRGRSRGWRRFGGQARSFRQKSHQEQSAWIYQGEVMLGQLDHLLLGW